MGKFEPQPTRFGEQYSNTSVEVHIGGVAPYIAGDAGSKSMSVADARQLIANLLAACDAAEQWSEREKETTCNEK